LPTSKKKEKRKRLKPLINPQMCCQWASEPYEFWPLWPYVNLFLAQLKLRDIFNGPTFTKVTRTKYKWAFFFSKYHQLVWINTKLLFELSNHCCLAFLYSLMHGNIFAIIVYYGSWLLMCLWMIESTKKILKKPL
jgi:hypothetical protein